MSWEAFLDLLLRLLQIVVIPFAVWVARELLCLRRDYVGLAARVSRNEERLDELPGTTAVHQLALGIEALRGEVRAVGARIGGLETLTAKLDRILERQETYLLNGGADKK